MDDSAERPLTQTLKPVYVHFKFKQQDEANAFAKLIPEADWTVSVTFSRERGAWMTTVRRRIHPVFREITIWLAMLTARATAVGGDRDGWGYEPFSQPT